MPVDGKTTLHEDPVRMEQPAKAGRGERDEEPSRKGRPGDEVKAHHEAVEAEGEPARGQGGRRDSERSEADDAS